MSTVSDVTDYHYLLYLIKDNYKTIKHYKSLGPDNLNDHDLELLKKHTVDYCRIMFAIVKHLALVEIIPQ